MALGASNFVTVEPSGAGFVGAVNPGIDQVDCFPLIVHEKALGRAAIRIGALPRPVKLRDRC